MIAIKMVLGRKKKRRFPTPTWLRVPETPSPNWTFYRQVTHLLLQPFSLVSNYVLSEDTDTKKAGIPAFTGLPLKQNDRW